MNQTSSQAPNIMQAQSQGMHTSQQPMHQMGQMQQNQYYQQNPMVQQTMIIQQLMAQQSQGFDSQNPTRQNQVRHDGAPRDFSKKHTMPSVFVGNLPKDFYDLEFFKFFKKHGYKIFKATVHTSEDKSSKRTNRFGFLQFVNQEEAERCQREMNNKQINGSTIYTSLGSPSSQGFEEKANIIARNLSAELTQSDLCDHFSKYGKIKSLKLETFTDGKSKEFCYIQFESKEAAEKCISEGNGSELAGKKIEVMIHQNKKERYGDSQQIARPEKFNNLYVQNLPKGTDDAKLNEMFSEFGEILSANVKKAEDNNFSRNGFVCFKQEDSAQKALDAMNRKKLPDGEYLIVSQHVPKRTFEGDDKNGGAFQKVMQKTYESNLFVKNIPNVEEEDEVKKLFETVGPIVSLKKKRQGKNFTGSTPTYAQYFILYADLNDAKAAIKKFDQSIVFGARPLSVEFSVSKAELIAEHENRALRQVYEMVKPYQTQHQQQRVGGQGPRPDQGQQYPRGGNQQRGGRGGGNFQNNNNKPRGQYQGPGGQIPRGQPQGMNPMMPSGFPSFPVAQPTQMQQQIQLTPEQINAQKQQIGDHIYPMIHRMFGEIASKITGVLLESPQVDTMRLTSDEAYLSKISQEVYNNLMQQLQAQQQFMAQSQNQAAQQ